MRETGLWQEKVLEMMEHTHRVLAAAVPPPVKVQFGDGFAYRFLEQTLEQVVVQKLARITTGLHSAQLLLGFGYLQEAAILQRGVDEAQEDTIFLAYAKICGPWTEMHDAFLKNFWADALSSSRKIGRPKIRDYIASVEAELTGAPADVIVKPVIDIYSMYSKYTHSSSAPVMELYDGSPPQWQLRGNTGSRLQRDHLVDIRNQYYRGAVAYAYGALLFNSPATFRQIMTLAEAFRSAMDSAN